MPTAHTRHGKYEKHQHPLFFVLLFLAVAVGALLLVTAIRPSQDTGSGETPGPDIGYQCTRGVPKGFTLSDVEGKTLTEVQSWAAGRDWSVRVVAADGQPKASTMDYRPDRVNVQVEADVVTRYCGNG